MRRFIDLQFRIDWPRGRYGYLPWNRADRTYGIMDKPHRARSRKYRGKIDLGKNWKVAYFEARHQKKNQFERFLDNLIDTVLHEVVHKFQPRRTLEAQAEKEASNFAMYGRWTRR